MSLLYYDISWNYTHRGDHKAAVAYRKGLDVASLRKKLTQLIGGEPRCCRIWVDGKIVWYYNAPKTYTLTVEDAVDAIIEALELSNVFTET